ncbi:MAG TPA: hypothetical protein DCZ71_07745 [Ruminococcus sp.]|nr:hypothetical protein [Ruminococcus sp.]
MDTALITAAAVLAVIAAAEIICLFLLPCRDVSPLYAEILPVFSEDDLLPQRLDCLALRSGGRTALIIVDYSATEQQLELCRQFCSNEPDCTIISAGELEKILLKTFAIPEKV